MGEVAIEIGHQPAWGTPPSESGPRMWPVRGRTGVLVLNRAIFRVPSIELRACPDAMVSGQTAITTTATIDLIGPANVRAKVGPIGPVTGTFCSVAVTVASVDLSGGVATSSGSMSVVALVEEEKTQNVGIFTLDRALTSVDASATPRLEIVALDGNLFEPVDVLTTSEEIGRQAVVQLLGSMRAIVP
jgi:hypothetical protein